MTIENAILDRVGLLMGEDVLERMKNIRVIIFGIGGVGSWCAESLVRSGIRNLTIVDSDRVGVTNINRQRMATTETVGKWKVDALKDILLSIMPDANITTRCESYTEETADQFDLGSYDYIIDAIDSIKDKSQLIINATRTKSKFFSSMGAALKLDPTRVRVAEFYQVKGCPLARALRQRFKKEDRFPAKKFKCVYSDELLQNKGYSVLDSGNDSEGVGKNDDTMLQSERDSKKKRPNGSIMHITAIFGLTLAGLVLNDIYNRY